MGVASITLEDDRGAVACKLVFSGGYDPASGAHQAAQILISQMDALMERRGHAVIDPLVAEKRADDAQLAVPAAEDTPMILLDTR